MKFRMNDGPARTQEGIGEPETDESEVDEREKQRCHVFLLGRPRAAPFARMIAKTAPVCKFFHRAFRPYFEENTFRVFAVVALSLRFLQTILTLHLAF